MKYSFIILLLVGISCRNASKLSDKFMSANLAALETTVDMENHAIDSDGILKYRQSVIDLGTVGFGEIREVTVEAVNKSDKPLVVLDAYTSCNCTQVSWDKKPIPAGEKSVFKVRFVAEQTGAFFKKIAVRHSAAPTPVTFAVQGIVINRSTAGQ